MNTQHPVEHLAFWKTKAPEIDRMKAIYDELVDGDPAKAKLLDNLIGWACTEASLDEAYNNADFSGN